MKGDLKFLEFDKIYLAYVWVSIKNIDDIHPGILLVEKPFDGNMSELKHKKYYLYVNINGILKSINIKYINEFKHRTQFNFKSLLNKYNMYKLNKKKRFTVLNEAYLNERP